MFILIFLKYILPILLSFKNIEKFSFDINKENIFHIFCWSFLEIHLSTAAVVVEESWFDFLKSLLPF